MLLILLILKFFSSTKTRKLNIFFKFLKFSILIQQVPHRLSGSILAIINRSTDLTGDNGILAVPALNVPFIYRYRSEKSFQFRPTPGNPAQIIQLTENKFRPRIVCAV